MPDDRDWTEVEVEDVLSTGETPNGGLWCTCDGKRFCVPKTLIHDDSEVWVKGQLGTLVIPTWLAIEKGLV